MREFKDSISGKGGRDDDDDDGRRRRPTRPPQDRGGPRAGPRASRRRSRARSSPSGAPSAAPAGSTHGPRRAEAGRLRRPPEPRRAPRRAAHAADHLRRGVPRLLRRGVLAERHAAGHHEPAAGEDGLQVRQPRTRSSARRTSSSSRRRSTSRRRPPSARWRPTTGLSARHARDVRASSHATRGATAAATPELSAKRPVTLGVGEPFTATFKVAAYAALLLAMPLLLYQAYAFVLPAFSPREREVAVPLLLGVPFLFAAGVVFAYFLVLPPAINFLQNFNDDSFDILLQARDFYSFEIMVLIAMGALFQIPVGILAATRLGVDHPAAAAQGPPLRDRDHRHHRGAAARPGPGHDADPGGPAVGALRGLYPLRIAARPARRARPGPRGGRGGRRGRRRAPSRPGR